jgi:hypothetical protein
MQFDVAIIGFGVIGTESLFKLTQRHNQKKILRIAIIEKDIKKVPGGIAYNKLDSKFGFFNNPLRLSNIEFINWIKKKKNIENLIKFIHENKDYNLNNWLKSNKNFKNKKIENFDEIYFPRLFYSFFLEEKIKKILNNISKKKVIIKFYQGELTNINIKKFLECVLSGKVQEYKPIIKLEKIKFNKIKSNKFKSFNTKKIILGNGLLPPKFINKNINFKDDNYIWDFYTEGGTQNLIDKIKNVCLKKKKIKLIFIGNKAGLLETMPELENLIKKSPNKINIITIAPSSVSLEKAEHSSKFNSFRFKFLVDRNIKKINKSIQILNLLIKEFNFSKKKGFNKYDVWTWVLKKELIFKCYNRLSTYEKKKYNDETFSLIRNITRYTYPNTIFAKKRLERKKILKFVKDKVIKLIKLNNLIKVETQSGKKIFADIVINVSGPVNFEKITNEVNFIQSLKNLINKFNNRGFIANNDFSISENIYAPGTISSNFNPNRLTIIKAITLNSHKASNKILSKI